MTMFMHGSIKQIRPYKRVILYGGNYMRKYDMRICKCGRIHMIEMDKLDEALHNNKNLLLICAGCGKATNIGADIEPDFFRSN